MENLHEYYDQLTENERSTLDDGFTLLTNHLSAFHIPVHAGDFIERSVDAMALSIIKARPPQPTKDALVIEAISDKPRGGNIADLVQELTDAGLDNAMAIAIITPHEYQTEKQRRTDADVEAAEIFEANADALADTPAPDSTTDETFALCEHGASEEDSEPCESCSQPVRPGTQYSRNEAIAAIKNALKARGMRYSVTGGRGTSWGWIEVDILPSEYKALDEDGRKAAYRHLGDTFGFPEGYGAISIPASSAHYREYIERARGLKPTTIAQAYWD